MIEEFEQLEPNDCILLVVRITSELKPHGATRLTACALVSGPHSTRSTINSQRARAPKKVAAQTTILTGQTDLSQGGLVLEDTGLPLPPRSHSVSCSRP